MMKLSDTLDMMNRADYKERFKAEYLQLNFRAIGLKNLLDNWDNGELNFTPSCPRGIYNDQMEYMTNYMTVLANRAYLEGINLDEQN